MISGLWTYAGITVSHCEVGQKICVCVYGQLRLDMLYVFICHNVCCLEVQMRAHVCVCVRAWYTAKSGNNLARKGYFAKKTVLGV